MMTKKNLAVLSLVLLAFIILLVGYKYINPEQRNIAEEAAQYELSTNELFSGFQNEQGNRYIDQVMIISGIITEMDKNSLTLDNKVQVNFISTTQYKVEEGSGISIKGRCIGYDDLLELVKIDQATITD
ncbi:OB-fold protein [Flagellimonas sp.]|uniref:OB-fold protein n=1 Tax=Flagellimonas sp. TaxID=2058762 RepID=UPI003B50CD94